MRLKIVSDEEKKEKEELCCETHNNMRNHIGRVLSRWYDMISGSDEEVDDLYCQRMHFRYACKSRLNWSSDLVVDKLHETLMCKDFMIENIENNIDMKIKMEASVDFSSVDHTICVFLHTLQELTIKKQQDHYEKLADYVENYEYVGKGSKKEKKESGE